MFRSDDLQLETQEHKERVNDKYQQARAKRTTLAYIHTLNEINEINDQRTLTRVSCTPFLCLRVEANVAVNIEAINR